jgi:hypothetical protein
MAAAFLWWLKIKALKERPMEITPEQDGEIKGIMSGMQCPRDFECYKSGFENLSKVGIIGDGEFVDCLEKKADTCELCFSFGYGYFCNCPVRRYIANNFSV